MDRAPLATGEATRMSRPANPVLMAVVGAAHGLKGELRVKSHTGDPLALGDYGPLYAADGRVFEIAAIRPANNVAAIVRFKSITNRTAAERLTNTELFVDRSALQAEEEGEFYHADLIGLAIRDETGAEAGRVTAVQNYGGGDILEITWQGRKGLLIPFTRAAVPDVDLAAGRITIDTVAAGLAPDEDGDGEPDRPGDGFDTRRRPRGPRHGGNR